MLPRPGPPWERVADVEPNTVTVKFPAIVGGREVVAEAIARHNQIDFALPGCPSIEIPLYAWEGMPPFLTAAAYSLRPD